MGKSEEEYPGLGVDAICPNCGKHYVRNGEWIYHTKVNRRMQYLCSWTCYWEVKKTKRVKG